MDQEEKGLTAQPDGDMSEPAESSVPATGPKGRKERSAEQESQRMRRIRAYASILAVVLISALAIIFWNDDGTYQLRISTDEGYSWQCEIKDESVVRIASEELTDGKYICVLEGLGPGEVDVELTRTKTDSPGTVAEERTYHLTVTDDNYIIQNSVERQLYE